MVPVYDNYKKFLKDKCGLELIGDKYWRDNSIIKGFTGDGKEHKLYKLKVNDDLSMEYSCPYKEIPDSDLITFDELVEIKKYDIEYLEYSACSLIEDSIKKYPDHTPLVPVSTGKDSIVTLYLTRLVNPNAKAIFNNTSLDVADSYRFAKSIISCEIMNPEEGFYPWVKRTKMYPTRFSRACCSIFKTGVMVKNLDKNKPYLMFMGLRNEESSKRADYKDEWKNIEWGKTSWQGILPIRTWTELEVWLYIMLRDLPINEKYKKGYQRVGCGIACPFYTKTTWVLDDYWYPYLRNRWVSMLKEDFISEGKAAILNCTIKEYIEEGWNGGVVRDEPTDDVIKEFMQYKNIADPAIARNYFNTRCSKCGEKLKKDETAMSMKFHGRETDTFFCKKCFCNAYNIDKDKYNWYVDRFKTDGCCLF